MNTSELLFPLCAAWSWPCCTEWEPLFSPISAPTFCTPENFVSEEAVCCPPLCSALHDMKLSTRAEWSAFNIRAFVSRIGNKRLLQQIYFCTRSLGKTKDSFTFRSLQPWTRHPSDLPAELLPPVPTVFYMMLLNVFKEAIEILLFLKFLLFSIWTISIGGFW